MHHLTLTRLSKKYFRVRFFSFSFPNSGLGTQLLQKLCFLKTNQNIVFARPQNRVMRTIRFPNRNLGTRLIVRYMYAGRRITWDIYPSIIFPHRIHILCDHRNRIWQAGIVHLTVSFFAATSTLKLSILLLS